MSEKNTFYGNDRLEYGQIILGHIQKILQLSLINIGHSEVGGRYKSAVISLGDSLVAYFDEEMNTAQEEFNKKRKNENRKTLAHYRKYFRELLKLIKRVDYFKGVVYGEDSDEIIEENIEGEENVN
jgi:hypothetical protein